MRRNLLLSVTALVALAGCESAEMGATGQMVQAPDAIVAGNESNKLKQTERGNSGGVLSVTGQPAFSGVEATMAYNHQPVGRGSGAQVTFHNGPLAGVEVNCPRAGGGATVVTCTATNADAAYLVNELSGSHAYAGAFAVNGYGSGGTQNGFVAIHSGPNANGYVQLPGTTVNYTGQFQAGGSLTEGGTTFSGRASGTMNMTADFSAGSISATMQGQLYDAAKFRSVDLNAGFTNAVVDPNGRFFNTTDTTFNYAGAQAWGELDGAFYGPNAEEAAGAFGFGNDKGGMTGILIGCSEFNPANCVAPTPGF